MAASIKTRARIRGLDYPSSQLQESLGTQVQDLTDARVVQIAMLTIHPDPAAATAALEALALVSPTEPLVLAGAWLVFAGIVSVSGATDFATTTLYRRLGDTRTRLASLDTRTSGFDAFALVPFAVPQTPLQRAAMVTIETTKSGAGAQLPARTLVVAYFAPGTPDG